MNLTVGENRNMAMAMNLNGKNGNEPYTTVGEDSNTFWSETKHDNKLEEAVHFDLYWTEGQGRKSLPHQSNAVSV